MNDADASNDSGLEVLIDTFSPLFQDVQPRVWSHALPGGAAVVYKLFGGTDSLVTEAPDHQFRAEQAKEKVRPAGRMRSLDASRSDRCDEHGNGEGETQ